MAAKRRFNPDLKFRERFFCFFNVLKYQTKAISNISPGSAAPASPSPSALVLQRPAGGSRQREPVSKMRGKSISFSS